MKWWPRRDAPAAQPTHQAASRRFAVGDDFATWQALVGNAAATKVSRAEAMRVPAVVRARNLLCGVIGSLPLHCIRESTGEVIDHALLSQPEATLGLVRSVTISRTVEDLLFEASSLWRVVTRTSTGFPQAVERVPHGRWSQDTDTGTVRADGKEINPADVVLLTSPNDPLLVSGASAIRALIRLEASAALYLDTPEPSSYFTPADGVDPDDDEEIERLLSDWQTARKTRATAWVPAAVQLNSVDRMTAEEMQLREAREFSVTEIARLTGVDATWLSVSVTTRQYSNIVDERRSFIDFVLSPYMRSIEERLSLGDVTPRGQRVLFNLDGFLRASTMERYNAHKVGLENGFLTLNEVRELENRSPLEEEDTADE